MSWGTCYTGSNNLHADFPPLMADGRNYANWQPGAVISDDIRKNANITTNWQYRQYLVKNADSITKFNQLEACDECCGSPARFDQGQGVQVQRQFQVQPQTPYLYQSVTDNSQLNTYGYEHSDLKNLYLADTQLQARLVTPVLTQAQLLQRSFVRAN